MPKVSVIIPVFNQAPYLSECLDSVLAQTLREIEVICVDDGSTDGSERMLDGFAARDGRVRVIHQPNAGVAAARNNGLDAAAGEFVAFMDPDDKYPDADVLADLVRNAERNGVDVCGGSMQPADGREVEPDFVFGDDGMRFYSDYQFEFCFCRYVFRRRLLEAANVRFPDLARFQDVPFLVEALHAAERFYALARPSYCFRREHHVVDWAADGSRRGKDNMRGMLQVMELARRYGYGKMERRVGVRCEEFVGWLGAEICGLRDQCSALRRELEQIRSSRAYRLSERLSRVCRWLKGGLRHG